MIIVTDHTQYRSKCDVYDRMLRMRKRSADRTLQQLEDAAGRHSAFQKVGTLQCRGRAGQTMFEMQVEIRMRVEFTS